MSREKSAKNGRKGTFLSNLAEIVETVFISIFVITMIFTYFLKVSAVEGESMQTTLSPDEVIISTPLYFSPHAGDIVIINADEAVMLDDNGKPVIKNGLGKQIVKRIIAVGGQKIDIDFERGAVYVDGKMLDEEYITGLTHIDTGAFTNQYPFEIPEGYVFVLGDNRGVSKDSRSVEIGLISEEKIEGKVFARVSPIERFGFI